MIYHGQPGRMQWGGCVFVLSVMVLSIRGDPEANSSSLSCPGCMYEENYSVNCVDSKCDQFPLDLIVDHDSVTSIDVSFNTITSVPNLVYPKLTYLDMSNNAITKLEEDTFKGCPELKYLNLTFNVLSEITSDTFSMDLSKTQHLNLSHNRISYVGETSFMFMHALTTLDLRSNNLVSLLDEALFGISSLEILHLENNQITKIDQDSFGTLGSLEYLSLRSNMINKIEEDSFAGLDKLQRLDLGDNQLEDLSENVFHEGLRHPFSELQAIHLDNNKLKTIHDNTFSPFPNLTYIFLDHNELRDIGRNKPFPSSLVMISLRRNLALKSIRNGTFSGLKALDSVDINGCYKLTEIEPGAFDQEMSSVTQLDASSCGLTHLSASLLSWNNMTKLVLSGNPWDCDCNLKWPKSTLQEDILITMQCSTPHQLKGQTLKDLDVTTMSCDFYPRHRHSIGLGLIIVATFIFILASVLLFYTYRKKKMRQSGGAGSYHTLYNSADDQSDPSVSIQVDEASPESKLLGRVEPVAV